MAVNDIVQFRLMDLDNKKIPICIDEATPYQREEFEGMDDHIKYSVDCKTFDLVDPEMPIFNNCYEYPCKINHQ